MSDRSEARDSRGTPKPRAGGLMALPGAELAKVVEDTVAMLRVTNPMWLDVYGDSLPARVQQILLEGEADARGQAIEGGESQGVYATGGIWITYDAEDGMTTVKVQVRAAWDEPEDQ